MIVQGKEDERLSTTKGIIAVVGNAVGSKSGEKQDLTMHCVRMLG